MHLSGRPTSLYLGDLVRLLHHHPEHGELLPDLLPASHDERVRQVGQGGG